MPDPVIVTYGDVTLHQSDCDMLEGPYWINDNLIAYYQQYLTLETFKDDPSVLFMGPSAMFLVLFMPDIKTELASLKLKEKNLIFMPVNDHDDINTTGGTHWTLLVYSKVDSTFYYFDSMNSRPTANAITIANKIASVLDITNPKIKKIPAPQQRNGYDCGFYVLAISEHVALHGIPSSSSSTSNSSSGTSSNPNTPLSSLTPEFVGKYRAKLKSIIQQHAKERK